MDMKLILNVKNKRQALLLKRINDGINRKRYRMFDVDDNDKLHTKRGIKRVVDNKYDNKYSEASIKRGDHERDLSVMNRELDRYIGDLVNIDIEINRLRNIEPKSKAEAAKIINSLQKLLIKSRNIMSKYSRRYKETEMLVTSKHFDYDARKYFFATQKSSYDDLVDDVYTRFPNYVKFHIDSLKRKGLV